MPTWYGGADIQPKLDEFGVSVTIGGTTAKCLLDDEAKSMLREDGSTFVVREISIVAKTGTFAALVEGVAVTADGVSYKATAVWPLDDGALTRAYLSRA